MNMTRALFGSAGRSMLLGLAVMAVIFAVNYRHPDVVEIAELSAGDLRMHLRHEQKPTGAVALVAIDDDSIAKIGQWPWPRNVMADLVRTLSDYKVAVIGMDILFPEPDHTDSDHEALAARLRAAGISAPLIASALGPQNDASLEDAMSRQGSTYLAYPFEHHYFGIEQNAAVRRAFTKTILNPPPVTFTSVL